MGIYDVNPQLLVQRTAEELKKVDAIKPPVWASFVKTGMSRERQPMQMDWWHIRAASVLRRIFKDGPIGTEKLRTKYGGRKNMGMAPEHFFPAGGSHLRKILQQLEKAGLAKQTEKGVHKGRVVTPQGMKLLENAANAIMKEQGIVLASLPKPLVEEKVEVPVEKKVAKKKAAPKKKVVKAEESKTPEAPEVKNAE
jgi:small subunit ribosomal protein S19e